MIKIKSLKKGVMFLLIAPFLFVAIGYPLKTVDLGVTKFQAQKEEIQNLAPAEKPGEATRVLTERKNLILSQIKENPRIIKDLALPESVREKLTQEQRALVEEPVKISGKLLVLRAAEQKEEEFINLETGQEKLDVYFIKKSKALLSGEVVVDGLRLANALVVDDATEENLVYTEPVLREALGSQKVLVILNNFVNVNLDAAITKAAVESEFISEPDSTNNFYIENSYSKLSLNVTVTEPLSSGFNSAASGCNYYLIEDAARASAITAGYNLATYQRVVYLFPRIQTCGWAGLGQVGGTPSVVWINGYNNSALFSHELGHNFGAGHADTLDCGTKAIADYEYDFDALNDFYTIPDGVCHWSEYGDLYDVMGGSWESNHMHAAFKEIAGWINESEVPIVSSNQTVTINPLEESGSLVKAVRILNPDSGEYYWIEYKKKTGFDTNLPDGVVGGATISIFSDTLIDTLLLDLTPTDNWANISLTDGASFKDEANDITITQVSHNASAVTLNIAFKPATPPVNPVVQPATNMVPVYRFWNANGTHFYTASETEKNNIIAKWPNIYKFEGVSYWINAASQSNSIPLYRLWNNNGTHFYTASYSEAMNAVTKWPGTFKLEGVAYNVSGSGTPVYRFWNANGTHFYTISETEKNNVIAKWPNIYKYEGISYYVAN